MRALPFFAGLLLSAPSAVIAAEPVIVMGLPLGEKLEKPILQCRSSKVDVRAVCQSGPTIITTTQAREVLLKVPGAERRPRWAADVDFNAWIGKDGTLREFSVRTYNNEAFVEILNSITGRFGQPQKESRLGAPIQTAEWTRSDIHIRLLCAANTGCNTTFISADQHARDQQDLAAHKAKDAARSPTP
jgi:hypothetical protein